MLKPFYTVGSLRAILTKKANREELSNDEIQKLNAEIEKDAEGVVGAMNEVLTDQNNELFNSNEALKKDNEKLSAEVNTLKEDLEKAQTASSADSEAKVADLQKQLDALTAEKTGLETSLATANTTISSLEANVKTLTDANEKLSLETGKALVPKITETTDKGKDKPLTKEDKARNAHFKARDEYEKNSLLKTW